MMSGNSENIDDDFSNGLAKLSDKITSLTPKLLQRQEELLAARDSSGAAYFAMSYPDACDIERIQQLIVEKHDAGKRCRNSRKSSES